MSSLGLLLPPGLEKGAEESGTGGIPAVSPHLSGSCMALCLLWVGETETGLLSLLPAPPSAARVAE